MQAHSRETSRLAFGLFDKYGRLRSEFENHPIIKGSGIWGQELNHGNILFVEHILVSKENRRQGIGRTMMDELLADARKKSSLFFAFAWPGIFYRADLRPDGDNRLKPATTTLRMQARRFRRATAFCRALGFRRVGSTIWFGLAADGAHKCHTLASDSDYDPPRTPDTVLDQMSSPFQWINDIAAARDLSHRPRVVVPDFLAVLQKCLREKGEADPCWKGQDDDGNTILHLTTSRWHVVCVDWLLSHNFGVQMLDMRNYRGETPLEMLQFELERFRTQRIQGPWNANMSDRFTGYHDNAVHCLILLMRLGPPASIDPGDYLRLSRGCTCGECVEGFLSPRMFFFLLNQASTSHHELESAMEGHSGAEKIGTEDSRLGYLSSEVGSMFKMYPGMR